MEIFIPSGPDELDKALTDEFTYALMLKSGHVIQFERVEYSESRPEWVTLKGINSVKPSIDGRDGAFCFERGMSIRISEIAMVADAPYGS